MIIIHHLIWFYYSLMWVIPTNLFAAYRFFTRKSDYNQYQVREKFATWGDAVNLFDLNPFKVVKSETKAGDEKKPYLEGTKYDLAFKFYIIFGFIYYIVDILLKIYEMKFPSHYLDICKDSFLIHHIFTVFSFKSIFVVDHYPWFLAFPPAYHTVLVAFPKFPLNNPIYLLSVVTWMYGLLHEPFWSRKLYKSLFFISVLLMLPIATLWWWSCMAEFKWD